MAYKAQRGYQGESDARVSYAKNRISDKQKTKVCKKIEKKNRKRQHVCRKCRKYKTECRNMQKIKNRMKLTKLKYRKLI